MIYSLIRFLFRITNKFYFKKLQIKGAENIPKNGPVFIVANHPSAFMDPIVIATITSRPLFFLGKGVLFENRFLKWLLPKFNVIPIFRSNETKGQASKNKKVFLQCYKHFKNGGALLAFPEGISLTERKIKKIQSGTARICLSAEEMFAYSLDIKIVAIGLNFSNPHKFRSNLFVNIAKPINVSDYYNLHKQDPFKAAHALSNEIKKRLENQVVEIKNAEIDTLVSNIELIYKSQLLNDLGYSQKVIEHDFDTAKAISDSVHYFMENDPYRVGKIKSQIQAYLNGLDQLSLNDGLINGLANSTPFFGAIKSALYLILGFPFFVYGFINNFLPFRIPYWSAKVISKRPEFHGSIAFSMGTLTFIVFYSVQICLINKYIQDWRITLAYIISLPVSGLFAFSYYKRFTRIKGNLKVFSLFYKKTKVIASLIQQRQFIVDEFESAKKIFLVHRDENSYTDEKELLSNPQDINQFFNLNNYGYK
jgi:1-acyl-sn-glycerol-3-phosphate acyltransferase